MHGHGLQTTWMGGEGIRLPHPLRNRPWTSPFFVTSVLGLALGPLPSAERAAAAAAAVPSPGDETCPVCDQPGSSTSWG